MTDADFVLSVLADHQPHSLSEILARSIRERGHGLTLHSRVADLRARGHRIHCARVPGASRGHAFIYTLIGAGPEPLVGPHPAGGSAAPSGVGLESLATQPPAVCTPGLGAEGPQMAEGSNAATTRAGTDTALPQRQDPSPPPQQPSLFDLGKERPAWA